jgi:hypothetical protein
MDQSRRGSETGLAEVRTAMLPPNSLMRRLGRAHESTIMDESAAGGFKALRVCLYNIGFSYSHRFEERCNLTAHARRGQARGGFGETRKTALTFIDK